MIELIQTHPVLTYFAYAIVQAIAITRYGRMHDKYELTTASPRDEVMAAIGIMAFFAPIMTIHLLWKFVVAVLYFLTGGNIAQKRKDKAKAEADKVMEKMKDLSVHGR